jgi:FSR family fosmidomycin resistance protein-like MFS transporter
MQDSLTVDTHTRTQEARTRFRVLGAISFSHFLNDMIQSLIIAIYPVLKGEFQLSFAQVGAITLTYQVCASVLQPLVGAYTDKHPKPHSLSAGMGFTLAGLVTLAFAPNYPSILLAAALVGTGSSIFHPESARIARFVSGGRHGLAQSIFQVGGSGGSAVGPLLAAFIIIPNGRLRPRAPPAPLPRWLRAASPGRSRSCSCSFSRSISTSQASRAITTST